MYFPLMRKVCLRTIIQSKLKNVDTVHTRSLSSFLQPKQYNNYCVHKYDGRNIDLVGQIPLITNIRSSGFFNKLPASDLWDSVTTVSNAGRKKGRAKNLRRRVDLNRGQYIGEGSASVVWPGLTSKITTKQTNIRPYVRPPNPERDVRLQEQKATQRAVKFKRSPVDALDRGWTSRGLQGKRIGPPDTYEGETFPGFDTIVLEEKMVQHMDGQSGRVRSISIFAATGNNNGLIGIALAKGSNSFNTKRIVKNRAAQQLIQIKVFNNHTVHHDFVSQFFGSKVFVKRAPEGHGLIANRIIVALCQLIGIKDIHVKCEGSKTNPQNVTKAFIIGLMRQKTFQELADEKKLYVVEKRKECYDFPRIVAAPSDLTTIRTPDEIPYDEELDMTTHVMDGKVILKKNKKAAWKTTLPSYQKFLKNYKSQRHFDQTRVQMKSDYGDENNFYNTAYKDLIPPMPEKKKE